MLLAGSIAHAQLAGTEPYNNKSLSAGFEVALPDRNSFRVGESESLKAELPLTDMFSVTMTAGYSTFHYKPGSTNGIIRHPADFVPVKAGAKYFFGDGIYTEGEAGASIETNYDKRERFAFALSPGIIIPTSKHTGVDVGIRFEEWGDKKLRQTALRVAYRVGK